MTQQIIFISFCRKVAELEEQLNRRQLEIEQLVSTNRQQVEAQRAEYDKRIIELAHDIKAGASQQKSK